MAETYDTILHVARRLFAQQGYTATSIRQIAEETGIGKATVYHHFPDKQAIILALLKNTTDQQAELLETIRAEPDPRKRIEVTVAASTRTLLEIMDVAQVTRREVPEGRALMQSTFIAFLKEFRTLVAETIRQGTEQGAFRPIDPEEGARVLMTMIQGTFAMVYLSGERPASTEEFAASLLDVFFHGIEAR
ncbi:MAG: TetR/AcrR family transcriptional regulator [Anaerolineae bacterium]|nr:TetR/AcrR family transcriptional regulator [Anaerolineae bacterium]